MTLAMRLQILELRAQGQSISKIADELGIWSYSVRWVLKQPEHLEKARQARKARGAADYTCGNCGEVGHNKRTCGVRA